MRDFAIQHNASLFALCHKRGIDIVSHIKCTGITYITLQKPSFVQFLLKIILCYCKNNEMASFLHTVEQSNRQNEIHIIFGYFNINIIEVNDRISPVLSNYTQFVREPIHISSLLIRIKLFIIIDHVYIKN